MLAPVKLVRSLLFDGRRDVTVTGPTIAALPGYIWDMIEGKVWVADWGNSRISVFSEDGEFVRRLRGCHWERRRSLLLRRRDVPRPRIA